MWQKVDPRWFRVWITQGWVSEWFAKSKLQSARYAVEDIKIRNFVDIFYKNCGVWKIVFRKWEDKTEIMLFTSKSALILWKDNQKVNQFKKELTKKFGIKIDVVVKQLAIPELSARVIAEHICMQLEKRMPYRKVAKQVLEKVMSKWAEWIKIQIGWRLNGAEMSRVDKFINWRVPLQTIRSDIDYQNTTALTKYGILWVKVWIWKWDVNATIAKNNKLRNNKKA